MSQTENDSNKKLTAYMSPAGAWAFSIGTSIGWGSFFVTCNTYLEQAGMSAFDSTKHTSLHFAFEEADVAMYENKRIMKGIV